MRYANELFGDVRFAFRILLKSPVATGVAILALALGIGVNASSFIPISALILHPFPYKNLDRIVTVSETLPKQHVLDLLAPADFFDLKRQAYSFEKLAFYRSSGVNLTGGEAPERLRAGMVSTDFFSVFGAQAAMGRTFLPEDQQQKNATVAVVSYSFWKSHLASAANVLGESLRIDGRIYKVVGVMPDQFDFPLSTQVWVPLVLDAAGQYRRDTHDLAILGLLKPGILASKASAESAAIALRLAVEYPDTNEGRAMQVVRLRDFFDDRVTSHFIVILLGAATFVLLLACANIGNLQLARATNRQKEIALRAALGAGRFQIARQLIAESMLISLLAGALGLVLATWNNAWGRSSIAPGTFKLVPGLRTMGVDSTVVLLTLSVSLVAGLLCCLPSIVQLLRPMSSDLSEVLRERSSGNGSSVARSGIRTLLIVFELALALVLLVGAGLMVQTFQSLLNRYQGFDPRNLLTMQVSLPSSNYGTPAQVTSLYDRSLKRLSELPGITAAGISIRLANEGRLMIENRPEPRPGEPRPEDFSISSHYLEAMRIPIIEGRAITDQDRSVSRAVVVISKSLARHYWPNTSPLGHRIKIDADVHSPWLTVVGVSGDVIENWFGGDPAPRAYVPYAQNPASGAEFDIRTSRDPEQSALAVRHAFRSIDRDLTLYDMKTMEQTNFEERGGVYAAAHTMTIYAIIALLLAATGIYAVIAYFVAARTHDIGVRMALGATRADVLKMTMNQTVKLIAIALVIGLPLAILLGRAMSSILDGVVTLDPATFAIFTGVLVCSAMLASYLPSRRATQIDPMIALRDE
ncbi:MAG: ABC transporter permease [Acidobacteriota bacterium]|nr:ABC transporter permease [Acidobacteriota bacterium]